MGVRHDTHLADGRKLHYFERARKRPLGRSPAPDVEMRIVVAQGESALLQRGDKPDAAVQVGTHVVLQEGQLFGGEDVAIPVSAVTGVQDGIHLNIGKRQVKDLPAIDHPAA